MAKVAIRALNNVRCATVFQQSCQWRSYVSGGWYRMDEATYRGGGGGTHKKWTKCRM